MELLQGSRAAIENGLLELSTLLCLLKAFSNSVLFFFLLDYRFLKRVSEKMGEILKEVTCSCWGWVGGWGALGWEAQGEKVVA